jgi:hypothetical protein
MSKKPYPLDKITDLLEKKPFIEIRKSLQNTHRTNADKHMREVLKIIPEKYHRYIKQAVHFRVMESIDHGSDF